MPSDKKLVNTEEENRAVNAGDTENPEESVSQEAAHTVNTESTNTASGERADAREQANGAVNDTGNPDVKATGRVEGDESRRESDFAE